MPNKTGSMKTYRTSLMAQMVKNLPAMQETQVQPLGWEDPLEKGLGTHSSILAWRIPWTEEPDEQQSMGLQRVRHDWVTNTHTHTHTWRPTTPSRTNTNKRCPFHHRGLECKNRKSRDTWSDRQVWPESTKWSRVKANRVSREHTGHSKQLFQQSTLHVDITR